MFKPGLDGCLLLRVSVKDRPLRVRSHRWRANETPGVDSASNIALPATTGRRYLASVGYRPPPPSTVMLAFGGARHLGDITTKGL